MIGDPKQLYIGRIMAREPLPPESYLNQVPAVRYLMERGEVALHAPVTFLVGENGSGKSTLLEAIAVSYGFNAEGGTRNFSFSTYATHSDLHRHIRLAKYRYPRDGFYLRAESFYNVATDIERMDAEPGPGTHVILNYGSVSLHAQSHGESFMAVVENRLRGNGLYIFDEPEAALSPMRLMDLLVQIDRLVRADSQFIIATHSPILMAYPHAELLELGQDGIRSVSYRETEHFACTLRFLENPERMLGYLLED